MARPLRIIYANAWYHVMNRGAAHAQIFHDSSDYQLFLDLLLQIHRRYHHEIHAYCLMPNHYHILLRTPLPNLSRGMRHLDGIYTQLYNKKHKKDGAIFRGRYKAILIDEKNYLLRLSRYIHLNPVTAGFVKHPRSYYWSSYKYYCTNISSPDWLNTKSILAYFGTKQQKNKYALFVIEQTDRELESFYRKTKLTPILGSDAFCKKIREIYLDKNKLSNEIPDQKIICSLPNLTDICMTTANYYHIHLDSLHKIDRLNGNQPRSVAIYLAVEMSGKKFCDIADYFTKISYSGISQIVRRINKIKFSNSKATLVRDIENIRNLLI